MTFLLDLVPISYIKQPFEQEHLYLAHLAYYLINQSCDSSAMQNQIKVNSRKVKAKWVDLSTLSEIADLGFLQKKKAVFTKNGVKNKKQPVSSRSVGKNRRVDERNQRKFAKVDQITTSVSRTIISVCTNLKAEKLQQKTTTLGSNPISQDMESEEFGQWKTGKLFPSLHCPVLVMLYPQVHVLGQNLI